MNKALDEVEVQRQARAFIAPLDLQNISTDLSVYLQAANAILRKEAMREGESGETLTRPDGKHIITVNSSESHERQRFTICHEIAHIVMGLASSHDSVPPWAYAKRHANEIACDWFAAELLMPPQQWLAAVPKGEPSFDVIHQVADVFGCSFPAAASRYATLTPAPCAFITMEHGTVKYAVRSTALRRAKAWITPRSPIPQGSVAHRVRASKQSGVASDTVAQDVWFEDWESGLDMTELSRHYGGSDTTVSILWFEESDLPEREFDRFGRQVQQDEGLSELTGDLPWPGNKKRR